MNNTIKQIPEEERPYEKALNCGVEVLSDAELLAIILRSGTNNYNALDISRLILNVSNQNKGLLSIHNLSVSELMKIPGIGKVKAIQVKCIGELCKRMASASSRSKLTITCAEDIAERYMEQLRHLTTERVILVMLNRRNSFIADTIISSGGVGASAFYPREIYLAALKNEAVNLVLVHNHPSGDPHPSSADISVTKDISSGCELIGINLLDHIIIGDNTYVSFKELELI